MSSRGSWYLFSVVAATGTLVGAGGAFADRGGVPNGGREDRPQPQGPPAAQQEPQQKATPPGQEQRPETAPEPPGQERRSAPRPRAEDTGPPPRANSRSRGASRSQAAPRSQSRSRAARRPDTPPAAAPAQAEDRGQDKTTICHSTGSDTNGFVEITVANPSLPAHARHGDLVPAPAGGCPGASSDRPRERIDICHATGSETNPYVLLEDMPMPSLNGHGGHEGDIIPAPEGGCPATQQPAGTLTEDVPPGAFSPRSTGDPPAGTGEEHGSHGSHGSHVPVSGVLGVTAEATAQSTLPANTGTGNSHNSDGSLPFTGLQLLLLVALGAGALAGGSALRRGGAVRPA